MTSQDIDKLFELLSLFRPGDKHLDDKKLRKVWLFVLEPYEPKDVREAVAEYFRERRYWPDVTEIAQLCPKPRKRADQEPVQNAPADLSWNRRLLEPYRELARRRRAAGLPGTLWEAEKVGLRFVEYRRAVEEAGLGFGQLL